MFELFGCCFVGGCNQLEAFDFMRRYFEHRQLDLSCVAYCLIDMGMLPSECESGSKLMKHLGFGEVAHTALEDAINTAKMYFKLLEKYKS